MKCIVEDVGLVVDDVDEAEIELLVVSMNTPPAMAGGDTVLAFVAAFL